MIVQINTGNSVEGGAAMDAGLEKLVRQHLSRFQDRLTRVEVHLTDENGSRGGPDDKTCVIEVRPTGFDPVKVTDKSATIHQAMTGALGKVITALERVQGKRTSRKGH